MTYPDYGLLASTIDELNKHLTFEEVTSLIGLLTIEELFAAAMYLSVN